MHIILSLWLFNFFCFLWISIELCCIILSWKRGSLGSGELCKSNVSCWLPEIEVWVSMMLVLWWVVLMSFCLVHKNAGEGLGDVGGIMCCNKGGSVCALYPAGYILTPHNLNFHRLKIWLLRLFTIPVTYPSHTLMFSSSPPPWLFTSFEPHTHKDHFHWKGRADWN